MDIAEAIDSADPSFLDNSEFQEADAIPVHDALPIKHYLVHEVSFNLFPSTSLLQSICIN